MKTADHPTPPSRSLSVILITLLLTTLGVALAGAQSADAQQDTQNDGGTGQVRDLTGGSVSEEDLVEALRPRVDPPRGARSITPPSCARYRNQMSRGIRPEPVSEEVAITIHFESDSARLTDSARKELDTIGRALGSRSLEQCCFRVQGHTDSFNTDDYNYRLSEERAQAAVRYLQDRFGIKADRLLVEPRGESEPLATNETAEGRLKNRRVQISNLGFQTADGGP